MKPEDVKELGKKLIGYDRQIAICGKVAADNVLYFWMQGYNYRMGSETPHNKVSFESEYALQEFREVEEQYFDNGKAYRNSFSFEQAERMLALINLLEADLKK